MIPQFETSYSKLPKILHRTVSASNVSNPRFAVVNPKLAKNIGIDPQWLDSQETLQALSGNITMPQVPAIAMRSEERRVGKECA